MDTDPDPGSPKTCGSGGSGSATLIKTIPCVCRRAEPCGLGAGQILAKLVQLRESSRRRVTSTENRRIRRLNLEYLGRP